MRNLEQQPLAVCPAGCRGISDKRTGDAAGICSHRSSDHAADDGSAIAVRRLLGDFWKTLAGGRRDLQLTGSQEYETRLELLPPGMGHSKLGFAPNCLLDVIQFGENGLSDDMIIQILLRRLDGPGIHGLTNWRNIAEANTPDIYEWWRVDICSRFCGEVASFCVAVDD